MKDAPLYNALAEGPEGGQAWWLTADDGVRLRAAMWPGGTKGTVFLLQGRTEYCEKYGRAASDLAQRGFATITMDWRGQGLSDRLIKDPMIGHVRRFSDYQRDLRALVAAADTMDLPRPYSMIAHSMGGCIGLRALMAGLPFRSAVFSAPMWGINMAPHLRPVAWVLGALMTLIGRAGMRVPGTSANSYVLEHPFDDNELTSDEEMFAYMRRQTRAISGVALGGPSLQWLFTALWETLNLRQKTLPDHRVLTFLGGNERIVDPRHVHQVMAKWASGELRMIDGAEHEIMMEKPAKRALFFDAAAAFFDQT